MSKKSYKQLGIEFKKTKCERIFTELYLKIKPGLTNYVNRIIKDIEDTNDIVSVTMTKVFNKIDQYDEQYQITTWIYKIAYNEALHKIKSRNKTLNLSAINTSGERDVFLHYKLSEFNDPERSEDEWLQDDIDFYNRYNNTIDEIENLPELYRPYMIARFLNNKSYNEILDEMSKKEKDISLQTVKNRIFRGRKIVQKNLESCI